MASLAGWCFRHRVVVLGLWLAALIGLAGASHAIGTSYNDGFTLPGTPSSKALALLASQDHAQSGDVDSIVFHAPSGQVTDPAVRAKIDPVLAKIATLPQVGSVRSPFGPGGATQISADDRTAYASVTFDRLAQNLTKSDVQRVVDTASTLRSDSLQVEFGGAAIEHLNQAPTARSELIGLAAGAVVLFIAFGSLLAMAIPLLAAIFALGSAISAIGLLTHVLNIGSIAPTIAALVGLGVGIDYALFIVTRHRNGIKAGLSPGQAATTALDTAGRAVLFAGATVIVAMMGMLVLGVSFLSGIGIAAAVMVLFAVAAATTLLPALFGLLGIRVLSRRERAALTRDGATDVDTSGGWARWAAWMQRRPVILATAASMVMIALVIPFFSLRLGSSDQGNDPASSTTRKAYDLLADGFGAGYNGPLLLVAQTPTAADRAALDQLVTTLKTQPGVASVATPPAGPDAAIQTVQVIPTTSPQSAQTAELINTLRNDVIPAAEAGSSLQVYVGGQTAIYKDFAAVLTGKLPLFIAVIVILGCLLLLVAFRSLVIPLTAAVMNLLAAGAGFGVVVAIFQWGWGSERLGLGAAGPVEAFLPVILIAILFGLSMDYEVFLVSRMHEEWVHTHDNSHSIRTGQAATGRVITAAATIMICVFLAFVLGDQRVIAEFGIGLAAAIFLDAFVLRTVLVPSLMHLFGRANWWLPGWLDKILPHVSVEPADQPDSPIDQAPNEPLVIPTT